MAMRFGIADAFIEQPGAHLVVALEPQPGREEALTDEPDLVLDLTLLPARCRRARLLHKGSSRGRTSPRGWFGDFHGDNLCTSNRLISAIASPGFRFFGQACAQLRIV